MKIEQYLEALTKLASEHPGSNVKAFDFGDDLREPHSFDPSPEWSKIESTIYVDGTSDTEIMEMKPYDLCIMDTLLYAISVHSNSVGEGSLMERARILYELQCGHIISARAFLGAIAIECPVDNGLQKITDVHVWEWRMRCQSAKCSYARWTGLSRKLAEFLANGHKRSKPTHDVGVEYVKNGLAVRVQDKLRHDGII